MRIVFMGTPDYALPSLCALLGSEHEVAGVFTQPDKPSGRGNHVNQSPVKKKALEAGIPVYQPRRIRVDGLEALRELKPDLCVTAAFGQILSREVLSVPRIGTVNVHASLLPEFRGACPIQWSLIRGRTETGVTTMMTDEGIDTGDILLQRKLPIEDGDNAGTLTEKLAQMGAELLMETLRLLSEGKCPRQKQDESRMSYEPKIDKAMARIDFSLSAEEIRNRMRAFDPWPGAYCEIGGQTYKLWSAHAAAEQSGQEPGTVLCADGKRGLLIAAGQGILHVDEMQAPGGKRMACADYLRGHQLPAMKADGE